MMVPRILAFLSSTATSLAAPLADHLWQSTLFAAAAGLLTLALRNGQARVRYWLWLAASVKFLVPFAPLVTLGGRLAAKAPAINPPALSVVIRGIGQPFAAAGPSAAAATSFLDSISRLLPVLIVCVWLAVSMAVLFLYWLRWRRAATAVSGTSPTHCGREFELLRRLEREARPVAKVRLVVSESAREPGVVGIFRPTLLLPAGISSRLTEAQLRAIITHELCHVRRRDNLAAAVHMLAEAFFWFHPMVWWIGARLVNERERACDEAVLSLGHEAETYADGILRVCKFYLESPRLCVAGIAGPNLKRRIEGIMIHRIAQKLGLGRKLLLALMGSTAVAGPVVVGFLNPAACECQTTQTNSTAGSSPSVESASIKPNRTGDEKYGFSRADMSEWRATNVSLANLISYVYRVSPYQIAGGPDWVSSARYDVAMKVDPKANGDQIRPGLQTLIVGRFKLTFHRETKQLPVYALVVASGGAKLQEVHPAKPVAKLSFETDHLVGSQLKIAELVQMLEIPIKRGVVDKTGLAGLYDLKLDWHGQTSLDLTSRITAALQEQLGLELREQTLPVETIVIDSAEQITGGQ